MIFKNILASISKAASHRGYSRASLALLQLTDDQLKEAGLSRESIKQGYAGWPWNENTENNVETNSVSTLESTQKTEHTNSVPASKVAA